MRIKEATTKNKVSWYLDKFFLLVPQDMYGEQFGEYAYSYQDLKVTDFLFLPRSWLAEYLKLSCF